MHTPVLLRKVFISVQRHSVTSLRSKSFHASSPLTQSFSDERPCCAFLPACLPNRARNYQKIKRSPSFNVSTLQINVSYIWTLWALPLSKSSWPTTTSFFDLWGLGLFTAKALSLPLRLPKPTLSSWNTTSSPVVSRTQCLSTRRAVLRCILIRTMAATTMMTNHSPGCERVNTDMQSISIDTEQYLRLRELISDSLLLCFVIWQPIKTKRYWWCLIGTLGIDLVYDLRLWVRWNCNGAASEEFLC